MGERVTGKEGVEDSMFGCVDSDIGRAENLNFSACTAFFASVEKC
jgi:hypothetical protein